MTQMVEMQEWSIEGERAQLASRDAHNAVHAAFDALTRTILVDNARTRTLEHLVGEMMRPMLKSWLDDNLPTLVDRLVRAEIERVSPPRRMLSSRSQ
jgi:cell pole-organizing protein PopZ